MTVCESRLTFEAYLNEVKYMDRPFAPVPESAQELIDRQVAEWRQFHADKMLAADKIDGDHFEVNTASVVIANIVRIQQTVHALKRP